jgi:DNA repair protein RadC
MRSRPEETMEQKSTTDYVLTIREMNSEDRPRERLIYNGAAALNNAELLAIILRVGSKGENVVRLAEKLLSQQGGLLGLAQMSVEAMAAIPGMGVAKSTQVKAALELGRRLLLAGPNQRAQICSPADVANLLMLEMGFLEKEELRAVLLDTKNFVHRIAPVYAGSLNAAVIRVGEVFRDAVRANCAAIIVVHNHPSGDPAPSPEDVRVTEQLVEAGKLLDIAVLDHVIIGRNRFVSLKERGLGFGRR